MDTSTAAVIAMVVMVCATLAYAFGVEYINLKEGKSRGKQEDQRQD